ncbi:MAG: AAA family ATPase [Nanoarchaeota archaeon]|nr:AAA family ATPase [Nanoarchaeota archaeon]
MKMKKGVNVKEWVKDALKKGYSNIEIVNLLRQSNYSEEEIKQVLGVCDTLSKIDKLILKEPEKIEHEKKEILELQTPESELKKEAKEIPAHIEVIEIAALISKIKKEMAKVVIGQDRVIDVIICALICDGHVLLEGIPGIAKTLIIKTLAEVSGCSSNRIQFTVDLLPTDILGITSYSPKKGFEVIKGPIFANFIIADEINRSPPKCVLGDTPIITENGEIFNIKEIIKTYGSGEVYKKNNESWIVPKEKLKLLAFDVSDYKIKPEEVKFLYKQKTSENYYDVKLKSGRKIKTSKIHPFFTFKNGKVKTIQANELKNGDCVLIPRQLSISGNNKFTCDKKFLDKSEKINQEIARRKTLYARVQNYKKRGIIYKKIKERLQINNKTDENLIKTFMRVKPGYLNYFGKKYFFSESKQFGQIRGIKKPEFVTKDLARFMAILIAEANVTKSSFYLTMKGREIPELFIRLVKSLFDLNVNLLYDRKRKQYRVAFRSDALADLLKAGGYNPNLKAGNKYIPKFILSSTDDVVKEFLKLYYDCDGGVSRDCIKVTTKSKNIANSLSYLLLRMGFIARINKELFKTKIKNYSYKRNFYNLRLYGAELYDFYKKINFFSERNTKKLVGLIKTIKRKNTDLIPEMHQAIRNLRKNNKVSHKQFYDLVGMHAHNLENPKNALMHSRYRLGEIAKIFGNKTLESSSIIKLINGDFCCDFVKENNLVKPKKPYWLYDFSMKNKHSFVAGFGGIISHNTQSAMIEAMQEKQVTIGKETFKLPIPFFVMANNNPIETGGVYTLPEAQIDRFLFKVLIDYPKMNEEKIIMAENITLKKFKDFNIKSVLSSKKILDMQKIAKRIYLDDKIKDYIFKIVDKTRKKDFENGQYIEWGGSPRASIGLFIASKAWALMKGRNYVIPKDVKDIAHYVLRHRIILNYKARAEKLDSDKLIDEILGMIII